MSKSNTLNNDKVADTVKQFEVFFEIYQSVFPYLAIDENKKVLIEKRQDWISRLNNQEFPVAFLGSFSAGKSTIINGILGREVLPESIKSTTAFPTLLKKGTSEQAIIHYIDEDNKKRLWRRFSLEIENTIQRKDFAKLQPQERLGAHLSRIEDAIQEYEKTNGSPINRIPFEKLKTLLSGWNQDQYKESKNISLSELKQYVEGHRDALYIDRIEVFLANNNLPDDIVLVDLPGLAVDNQRHVEFTKQYIIEKSKAFVVCMKPKSLLDGEEIVFLDETNRSNPTILQRSFWIINQWDTLNEQQRKEEEVNFTQKIQDRSFFINNNRVFKVSALNYLLVNCMANNTINSMEKLKSHVSNLKQLSNSDDISSEQCKDLLKHPEIVSFSEFSQALFNYLNKEAREEFIADARQEVIQVIRILESLLRPLYEEYSQSKNIEEEFNAIAINRQLTLFVDELKRKVKHFAQEIRTSQNRQFWQESDTKNIIDEINNRIIKMSRNDLENSLRSGQDIQEGNFSRLPAILEPIINITPLIREKLVGVIDKFFIQRLGKLLTELETVNRKYLPEEVIKHLEDKLCDHDISMRLRGLADALLYNYGQEIEKIGSSLLNCKAETFSDRLNEALAMYKNKLEKLIQTLTESLNSGIHWSIKNHTEDLEEELLLLFDDYRDSLTSQIARNIDLTDKVAEEKKKQIIINSSYTKLINLRESVMESLGYIINNSSLQEH